MAEFGKKDTLIFGGILLVSGVLMKIINDKVETSDWGETYLKARELKLKRLGYLKKAEGETCESCVWRPTYMGTRNYIVACQVCGAEKKLPLRAEEEGRRNKWLQAIYDAIYDENDPAYQIMYHQQGQYGFPIVTTSDLVHISMMQQASEDGRKPPTKEQVKNGMMRAINEASGTKLNPAGKKRYGGTKRASYVYGGKRFFVEFTPYKPHTRGAKEGYSFQIKGMEYFENPMLFRDSQAKTERLGMYEAESNFDRLANEIAEQYEEKGKSQEEAERIGRATAYKVGVAKYGKEGMAKKAIQGRKQNAETFNAENRDLAGADLRGFYFVDADLSGANLQGADLSFTDILRANLRDANLQGANLFGADLQSADLRGAWLRNADLRGANLPFADLRDAKLSGADFRGAKLSEGQREMIIAGGGILE